MYQLITVSHVLVGWMHILADKIRLKSASKRVNQRAS